jgi:hypothetical protein
MMGDTELLAAVKQLADAERRLQQVSPPGVIIIRSGSGYRKVDVYKQKDAQR